MMLADADNQLSALLLSMPLWPLLGSVLVGVFLATGKLKALSDKAVVGGVGVSALLGVITFFSLMPDTSHDDGHADASSAIRLVADGPVEEPSGHSPKASNGHADASRTHTLFHWISLGLDDQGATRWIDVNYYIDGLTGIMLVVVTVISLLVVIYSTGYMRDHHGHPEVGYERFFAFLGLFVFSMLMLVLAGNFVLLYLGWEAVGLCSYLLIGFYYQKPEAAAAAKKAFLVNRIGDLGFALGIFALYLFLSPVVGPGENPLDYAVAFKYADTLNTMELGGVAAPTLVSLLLLCGALGKSAQFPLYVWLPDAMEGPSPVSALIHAATMVTAGVYMVARCAPIFIQSEVALFVVMVIGLIGAVLAATMAMAQYDMKRILAYSTMSQLAFMFVALGAKAPQAAIFHLYTHAFFKALLFLSAGSVMHAMGNVIDVRLFSGLRRVLPHTYRLMLIGCLALAGFPLLAGFWSKDEIVSTVMHHSPVAGWILLFTAFLTAYYTFRMFFLCFNGEQRFPKEAGDHPHEMPGVMLAPKYLLAIGAVLAGYIGVSFHVSSTAFLGALEPHGMYHGYIENSTIINESHHSGPWLMYLSAAVALAGIGLAWARYGAAPRTEPDQALLGPIWNLWNAKYYVDELFDRVLVRPLRGLGRLFVTTDNNVVDGLITFCAAVPRGIGAALQLTQRGVLQGYALGAVVGVTLLLLFWKWIEPAL